MAFFKYCHTTQIRPGQVILKEDFSTWAFHDEWENASMCNNCFKVAQGLKRCIRCKHSYYCTRACQTADWKARHEYECKYRLEKAMNTNWTPWIFGRQVAQMIIDDIPGSEIFSKLPTREMPNATRAFPASDELSRKIFPALMSFSNWNDEKRPGRSLGLCICVEMGTFPHSCNPNAVAINIGKTMFMIALKSISNLAQVRLAHDPYYNWFAIPRLIRQFDHDLKFGHECFCARCQEGDGVDMRMYGLVCPKKCGSTVYGLTYSDFALKAPLPGQIKRIAKRINCNKCHAHYTDDNLREIIKLMHALHEYYELLLNPNVVDFTLIPQMFEAAMAVLSANNYVNYLFLSQSVKFTTRVIQHGYVPDTPEFQLRACVFYKMLEKKLARNKLSLCEWLLEEKFRLFYLQYMLAYLDHDSQALVNKVHLAIHERLKMLPIIRTIPALQA